MKKYTLLLLACCGLISVVQAQTSFNISNKTSGDTLLTIDNNGNVGIGTTVPQTMVDVRSSDPDMGGQLRLGNQDLTHYLRLYGGRLNNPNPFILWNPGDALRFGTAFSQELMRLSDTGNLGIGTVDPTAKLDVRGNNPDDGILFSIANSDQSHRVTLFPGRENDPNPFIRWTEGDPLRFSTTESGWSEKMRIAANGNVGIGTETPREMLEVADTIYSSVGGFKFPDGSVQETAAGLGEESLWSGETDIYYTGGNVGIGTTTPLTKIHVKDSELALPGSALFNEIITIEDYDAGLGLYSDNRGSYGSVFSMGEIVSGALNNKWSLYRTTSIANPANQLRFSFGSNSNYTANATRMALSSNGMVGIGTTNPTQMLEVAGTVFSNSGGFRFPDGTTQITAATGGGTGNTLDQAYDQGGSGAGRSITADNGAVTIAGTDGFLSTGTFGSGSIPMEGGGTRMMWYPGKSALRVGHLSNDGSTYWNTDSIGSYSVAIGHDARAIGEGSKAMGYGTRAGGTGSIAIGSQTIANGHFSTAMGSQTTANSLYSTAMGLSSLASGLYSTAMGNNTLAEGPNSTSMGINTIASGNSSTAMGALTTASGQMSTATGGQTTASGMYSTAMGWGSTASGQNSVAMGYAARAIGDYSIAMGRAIEANNTGTVAISIKDSWVPVQVTQSNTLAIIGGKVGINTVSPSHDLEVAGPNGVLFNGYETTDGIMNWIAWAGAFRAGYADGSQWDDSYIGRNSIAMGHNTIARSSSSTALGSHTTATGVVSTAMGRSTTADGNYSTAMGSYVSTSGEGSLIIGDHSSLVTYSSSTNNSFTARFAGGYYFFTEPNTTIGARLNSGSNSWTILSDSTRKENFKAVDSEDFLNKISRFNLTSWNYKGQDPSQFRHYGPMAQDFYAAFGHDGIGTIGNDTTIASADFDGINFIAIQALEKRTSDLKDEVLSLKEENEHLKSELSAMRNQMLKVNTLLTKLGKQLIQQAEPKLTTVQ